MTNQEAIERIQERVDFYEKRFQGVVPEYHDALVMAIDALKKQEPKEIIVDEFLGEAFVACPTCGKSRGQGYGLYCKECGQHLKF